MVMKKTLVEINETITLTIRQTTICSDFIEIVMSLLTYLGALFERSRFILRTRPAKSHPLEMTLDCPLMNFYIKFIFQ